MIMKNILSILFIGLLSLSVVKAQDDSEEEFKTLFSSNGESSVSGFGGIVLDFSSVNGDFGYSMGAEGAALFNKSVFIGLYGQALVNFPSYQLNSYSIVLDENVVKNKSLVFYHGGFYTGFVFKPNNPIHFGISSKFGWGGVSLLDDFDNYYNNPNYKYPDIDLVFVLTPELEVEMNITNWFKFNMGIGYRFVSGLDETYTVKSDNGIITEVPYFESDEMNSLTFSMGFLFGWYK